MRYNSEFFRQQMEEYLAKSGLNYRTLHLKLEEIGIPASTGTISNWLNGKSKPKPRHIKALAKVLKLNLAKTIALLESCGYKESDFEADANNSNIRAQIVSIRKENLKKKHFSDLVKTAKAILGDSGEFNKLREKPKQYHIDSPEKENSEAKIKIETLPSGATYIEAELPFDLELAEADYLTGAGRRLKGLTKRELEDKLNKNIELVAEISPTFVNNFIKHLEAEYKFGENENDTFLKIKKIKAFTKLKTYPISCCLHCIDRI
jgi:transcriptional regulator with XRE-family HTH domain